LGSELYINKPLTAKAIIELLNKNPTLEKIKCPKSLYSRTSKKYLRALSELGITVEPVLKRGRPKKYSDLEIKIIQKMLNDAKSPKEISETLKISLKTIYYLKSSKLKRGRKPKYSEKTKIEVKKLYKNGISSKRISKKLNIPIRTVYYLLKR
jgi:hypothetical protein